MCVSICPLTFQKSFVGFTSRDFASRLRDFRFAAKQRSLRSPRGRLVASLICPQNWYLQAYIMPHWGEQDIQFCQNIHVPTGRSLRTADEGEATPGNTSGVRMLHWPRYRLHLENSRRSI